MTTRQRGVLKTVLAIVLAATLRAHSSALLSDSFDYLGDALTYLISLWAVSRSALAKAQVARIKGGLVVADGLYLMHPETPPHRYYCR